MERTIAPPLGVMPRNLWEERVREERIGDLKGAITRYLEANWPIKVEWVQELNKYAETLPWSAEQRPAD